MGGSKGGVEGKGTFFRFLTLKFKKVSEFYRQAPA